MKEVRVRTEYEWCENEEGVFGARIRSYREDVEEPIDEYFEPMPDDMQHTAARERVRSISIKFPETTLIIEDHP